jgi:hypothetical protein
MLIISDASLEYGPLPVFTFPLSVPIILVPNSKWRIAEGVAIGWHNKKGVNR